MEKDDLMGREDLMEIDNLIGKNDFTENLLIY